MTNPRFDELNLSPAVLKALKYRGFEKTTPVQAEAIPALMEWRDVIAKAPTGTGKTFAFGIPIIEHIDLSDDRVQALILAPTRELALQITDEMRALAKYIHNIKMSCLYGGQNIGNQINQLKKYPKVVIATPGRLLDHLNRRTIKLNGLRTVILDEADRMLDMGFYKDVTCILDRTGSRRNMGLFSATMSREVMDIGWIYQRDPVEVTVAEIEENLPDIQQFSLKADERDKTDMIGDIIEEEGYEKVLIFCNTKRKAERLTEWLKAKNYLVDCIHGDIRQAVREKVMQAFRDGRLHILVATDVVARGIDVEDIDAVFNYDIPEETERYVHRIGRTGRAKKSGVTYSFVTTIADSVRLDQIARWTRTRIKRKD
jgi:ATP-dependent RNA helicase DeaD